MQWYSRHARDLPWRRTTDPYAIWVSEIMLQQTQVKTVIPYWLRWMHELPTIDLLASAPVEQLYKLWQGLGYYRRVRDLQDTARIVVSQNAGIFPRQYDQLLNLPGIGRYTAGAICSLAFNQPVTAVDGNVIRVLARCFNIRGVAAAAATARKFSILAQDLIQIAELMHSPSGRPCGDFNEALMELGAVICTPREPKCLVCPIVSECEARRRGTVFQLPNLGPRTAATEIHSLALVIIRRGRLLVRQRPADMVNGQLWEFPRLEAMPEDIVDGTARQLGLQIGGAEPLCSFTHSITRYRIRLRAFTACFETELEHLPSRSWLSPFKARELPFTSADRKIFRAFSTKLHCQPLF